MRFMLARTMWNKVNAVLDRSYFYAAIWQKAKWRLKYMLNRPTHVPAFDDLISHPHREILCRSVLCIGNTTSVLEVGCGKGANLFCLRSLSHEIRLAGVDIDKRIITVARSELARRGASDIRLSVASATKLMEFRDAGIDVVLSDAVSMYVPPSAIATSLREMFRVAKSAVVLSTWHRTAVPSLAPEYDEGTWIYDYERLVRENLPGATAKIYRYDDGVWRDERWKKYGAIVVIRRV